MNYYVHVLCVVFPAMYDVMWHHSCLMNNCLKETRYYKSKLHPGTWEFGAGSSRFTFSPIGSNQRRSWDCMLPCTSKMIYHGRRGDPRAKLNSITKNSSLVCFDWLKHVIKCPLNYIPEPIKVVFSAMLLSFAWGSASVCYNKTTNKLSFTTSKRWFFYVLHSWPSSELHKSDPQIQPSLNKGSGLAKVLKS